jgi:hypothetical protein
MTLMMWLPMILLWYTATSAHCILRNPHTCPPPSQPPSSHVDCIHPPSPRIVPPPPTIPRPAVVRLSPNVILLNESCTRRGRIPAQQLHTHFIVPTVMASPMTHDLCPKLSHRPRTTTAPAWPVTKLTKPDNDGITHKSARPFTPPRRSTRLIYPRHPGNISIQALHHVMGLEASKVTPPSEWTGPIIDIEKH